MPSPNFDDRRGRAVDALILHYTGMETGALALARLRDADAQVSCHYLVWDDGRIDQLVAERHRAWHAGRSFWRGETDLNAVSVGIEIVNGGHDFGSPPFPAAQIAAVVFLCREILARHAIPAARVLAHSDVAPDRKRDPGERFPWHELAAGGVGRWLPPEPIAPGASLEEGDAGEPVATLQRQLATLGFHCPVTAQFDPTTRDVVTAFQRHWRPARVDGIVDPSTAATLAALTGIHDA